MAAEERQSLSDSVSMPGTEASGESRINGTLYRARLLRRPRFSTEVRPFIVIWEMTRACDLACVHCRAEAVVYRHPAELTTDEAMRLVEQVADIGNPAPLFVLTGGDPMKRPDLKELVAYAAEKDLPVALSPSATRLLTASALQEMHALGLKVVSLSIDGDTPRVHDKFRGVDGVFERTIELWDVAVSCGLKVQINTTVVRQNVLSLPGIARMARERNAMTWSVFFMVPTGRAISLEPLTADECEDVMNFLYDVSKAVRVKTTEGPHFRRVVIQRSALERVGLEPEKVMKLGPLYQRLKSPLSGWPQVFGAHVRRSPMEVNAARGFVFISHIGEVYPSGFLPIVAGNVRTKHLLEIYRESSIFQQLRDEAKLEGRCGQCEFKSVCGGSRSRAYGAFGNPMAEDPLCAYLPRSFPYHSIVVEMMGEDQKSVDISV